MVILSPGLFEKESLQSIWQFLSGKFDQQCEGLNGCMALVKTVVRQLGGEDGKLIFHLKSVITGSL